MADAETLATKLKGWESGLKAEIAKNPAPWNSYDSTIKSVIADYTTKLSSTPHYSAPDWQLIKAMLWTESGAWNHAWTYAPMQAGMPRDKGLPDILPPNEHSKLILPPSYATTPTLQNVPKNPTYNLMSAVALVLPSSCNPLPASHRMSRRIQPQSTLPSQKRSSEFLIGDPSTPARSRVSITAAVTPTTPPR